MAKLASHKDVTLLTINRQLILLDIASSTCQQIIDLPDVKPPPPTPADETNNGTEDNNTTATTNGSGDVGDEELNDDSTGSKQHQLGANRILHVAISPDGQLFAVATVDEKCLHLYRISASTEASSSPTVRLLSSRSLSRTSNALRFSNDSQTLFVADKTGDCFAYACAGDGDDDINNTAGRCVLSHLSMVLDIMQTPCGRFVLSCDRDEKIRCTNYPRTTVIEAYCLGHTEYVAAIECLEAPVLDETKAPSTVLMSVSGDRSLCLWNYLDGRRLQRFELPAPALRLAVRKVSEMSSHVVVTLHEHDHDVIVYEITAASADAAPADGPFALRSIAEFTLDDVVHVQSVVFDAGGNVLMAASTSSDEAAVFRLSATVGGGSYAPDGLDELNAVIAARAADLLVPFNAEEISTLFKKKFDNIVDYQERKRRRITEKNTKRPRRRRNNNRAAKATAAEEEEVDDDEEQEEMEDGDEVDEGIVTPEDSVGGAVETESV